MEQDVDLEMIKEREESIKKLEVKWSKVENFPH